uniref:Kch5 n=1 Tax=Arundo donax TaxID=35708 RepID=A0A0A8ZSQ2_ARUDO
MNGRSLMRRLLRAPSEGRMPLDML